MLKKLFRRNPYTTAIMKKSFPWCKTSDGKQTVLFDLSDLDRTWFKESVINQIMPSLEKYIGINSIEEFVFAIPVSTDNAELSIDIEFNYLQSESFHFEELILLHKEDEDI